MSCLRMGYSPKDLRHWEAWSSAISTMGGPNRKQCPTQGPSESTVQVLMRNESLRGTQKNGGQSPSVCEERNIISQGRHIRGM